ncbi:hypothetical protein DFJ43DRAFT_1142607 [Lentinula guzmanii]|uniref:Uncharacterized protein n=1 Tax=Lentinula guzmanii TaxID=2804957 RepID=A0AA38J9E0_9AGAR|nr:hypothetical protein DFJ43DRAFT_1142607 [Lentinula guzmanii]
MLRYSQADSLLERRARGERGHKQSPRQCASGSRSGLLLFANIFEFVGPSQLYFIPCCSSKQTQHGATFEEVIVYGGTWIRNVGGIRLIMRFADCFRNVVVVERRGLHRSRVLLATIMPLPNELLHSIIEYLAYIPKLPDSPSKSQFKCASPELLALSITNWRLRRICLPFLFANIKIRHIKDARRLEDSSLVLFEKFTKLLAISHFFSRSEEGDRILCPILPCMKRLEWVEVRFCSARSVLLEAILAQPSVLTVLVEQLPDASLRDNLSKVVHEGTSIPTVFTPNLERCLDQGMRLGRLEVLDPGLLNEDFGQRHFAGLEELRLSMRRYPVSFSWLSALSSTHSSLKELWLIDDNRQYFSRHTPIFISSFVEESQRQDLSKNYIINTSLVEILTLISISFPKLETLTLDLDSHKATYDSVWKQKMCATNTTAARAESGLLWFISRVAKQASSLDAIYINDRGYEYEKTNTGWLHVLNGNRDVDGRLRGKNGTGYCEIQLGTKMISRGFGMESH